MQNVFGNYVIQLIFERGSSQRIEQFYNIMFAQLHKLCIDQFGCRIIQKAIVWLPFPYKKEIISQFTDDMLIKLMFSEEGNYIVQCMIVNMPLGEIRFLLPIV